MIELNKHLGGLIPLDAKKISSYREKYLDNTETYCIIVMKNSVEHGVAYSYEELKKKLKPLGLGRRRVISC